MIRKRKPWLAMLFALILPGLGQLYCGRVSRAVIVFLGAAVTGNIAYAIMVFGDFNHFNIILPVLMVVVYRVIIIIYAYGTAALCGENFAPKWYSHWYSCSLIFAALAIFEAAGGQTYFSPGADLIPVFGKYRSYKVPSTAMEDCLLVGDYFIADLSAYVDENPAPYDVIVFTWPVDQNTVYVKRCLAGPGDVVEFRDKVIFINQQKFRIPKTAKHIDSASQSTGMAPGENFGPLEIPPDNYFVVGDNLDNSYDSRFWGTVPKELILGKARRIYWSSDWDRIGLKIE